MFQHWPVSFFKDVASHMDEIILVDAYEVLIVGRVVDLAEGKPIVDDGNSFFLCIANDMRGIQKTGMMKIAYRAMLVVRVYD